MNARRAAPLPVSLVIAAWLGGCTPAAPPEMEAVPFPDLSHVEAAVAEHLDGVRRNLEAVTESGTFDRERMVSVYGEAGMRYHAYAFHDTAATCYRNAGALDREDPRWPYYEGRAHEAAGRPLAGLEALERAQALDRENLPLLIALADLHFVAEQPDRAEPLYRKALKLDPSCTPAHAGLGRIASERREWEAAAAHFEQVLTLAPNATIIRYPLGIAYGKLGREEDAARMLANRGEVKVGIRDPWMDEIEQLARGSRIHNNRGTRLNKEGKYAEALAEFREAERVSPGKATVLANIGSTLTKLGRNDEAVSFLRRAVEADPELANAHYNLGALSARIGDDARAMESYADAIEVDPEHTNSHFNLANALRRAGRFEEALPHYRHVVGDNPAFADAWLAEAYTLLRLHRWREARERLEQAVAVLPEAPMLAAALVRVLAASPDEGVRDGERAFALGEVLAGHRMVSTAEARAMAAAEVGRFDIAVSIQEEVLEAVRGAGQQDQAALAEVNLGLYRSGRPCRAPWRDDDPLLSPRPWAPAVGQSH